MGIRSQRKLNGRGRENRHPECFFCGAASKLKTVPVVNRGMKEVCPDCEDLADIYLEADQ
jgi:hypothetical protein